MMESDFGYKLNLLLAMVRQNVGIVGVTIGGELFDLPLLAEDNLTGSLGVDDALECFERICRVCPAECKLAAAQIDAAGVQAFGVDSESSGNDAAAIIQSSGSAISGLFTSLAALFTAKNTTTTTTNTNATNSTTSTSSASASLGIYAGLSLGTAAIIALLIMNRK